MKQPILILLALLMVIPAMAQKKEYKGKMSVTPLALEQKGDSLYVSIDFDIRGVNVGSRQSVSLIPILVGEGKSLKLPEVMVKGRADYLVSKRKVALMSKAERRRYEANAPYAIVKGYNTKDNKRVIYRKSLPFDAWMANARLDIQEDLCGCGNPPRILAMSQLVNRVQLEQKIQPYIVVPYLAYVRPAVEMVKTREMVGEAFLDFVVGQTTIRPDYMNNPAELKKITDMIEAMKNDPAVTVKNIFVEGYASPEGTMKGNQALSEGRAKALVDYLVPLFSYPKDCYKVVYGGENWKGLAQMVEKSDLPYKESVLNIINNVPEEIRNGTSRKKQLMDLQGGEPYRYLLKNYFPSLRKAICRVDYQVKGFDVQEAKSVIGTHPQNLSLNEMYMVANTYEKGSPEFVEIFETAVRLFPQDPIANLNAAAAALSRNDIVSAERYLNKVSAPSAEFNNTKGALLMVKGDLENAKTYLEKAASQGIAEAKNNLEELRKKVENAKKMQ